MIECLTLCFFIFGRFISCRIKIEFFLVFKNSNENDALWHDNFLTRWCHWWDFYRAQFIYQVEEQDAANIVDGLNAIKMRAKSHLFGDLNQGRAGCGVNCLSALDTNLRHCPSNMISPQQQQQWYLKILPTSFLSPQKKHNKKPRRYKVWIKIRLKFDLNCFDSFLMDSNLKSFSIRLLFIFLLRKIEEKHSN